MTNKLSLVTKSSELHLRMHNTLETIVIEANLDSVFDLIVSYSLGNGIILSIEGFIIGVSWGLLIGEVVSKPHAQQE